ncbi:MAG: sialate O-acetylesterase [Candidatus Sulfotelmatobacter sp.]
MNTLACKTRQTLLVSIFLCVSASLLRADPRLSGLFSDHMVLQRQRDVLIWGWADPGEPIVVSLAARVRHAIGGRDGRWKVTLPSMNAGGPFLISVTGKKAVLIKDVMVGEVWVLSGQSNMSFPFEAAESAEAEIKKADYPQIRLFTVPRKIAFSPLQSVSARWETCNPETVKEFSAVGYFFGRELYKKLGVPIGLIHSSWPGTQAENWATPQALEQDPALAPILEHWRDTPAETRRVAGRPENFELQFDDFELLPKAETGLEPVRFSNFDDGGSRNIFNGAWTYSWQTAPGSIFTLVRPGRGGSGYAAQISGKLETADSATLRASLDSGISPADLSAFAGIRFYCRGQGYFRLRTFQPTISDWDDYGTESLVAFPEWRALTVWFKDLKQDGWGAATPFTPESLSGFAVQVVQAPGFSAQPPSGLFDGMIAPIIPFAIRGAAWYQGEDNASRAYQYRKLLPALIQGWRAAWGEGDFPFLIVQLPNYGRRENHPTDSDWAELREAQLMALRIPNTGLVVTIDLGEADDVHPHKKAEVGQRLAISALGIAYGKNVVYSGPLYESMRVKGDRIRTRFQQVGSGLAAHGDELKGFAVAGTDHVFHWAKAVIEDDTVVVSSPEVPAPVAVRYSWAANPDGNLFNKEGIPASPFRTDDWPGVTANEK